MGYIKLTKGASATTAGSLLIPADNVASVKEDSGEVLIRYFGGNEVSMKYSGIADQTDIVAILEAINEANGASGPAISITTPNSASLTSTEVQAWGA
tara:strand:- start:64 stop:354 length:291 start_codon:yes stop_codon:yes gene_type:complete